MRRLWHNQAGASAVEFAMLIAPFLLLLFGVIEISRALWTRQAAQDIATAAARCIGVMQTECTTNGVFDLTKTELFVGAAATGRAVRLDDEATQFRTGVECDGLPGAVEAQLQAHFDSVFPFEDVLDFTVKACFVDWSAL